MNDAKILADGGGADLFVVADDENGFAKVERYERHDVALTGLVDDDDIETCETRIEILDDTRQRHNPNRNSAAALGHFSGGFRAQERNANTVTLADPADGVEPANERLTLAGRSSASLPGPRAAVDEVDSYAAKVLTEFLDFRL